MTRSGGVAIGSERGSVAGNRGGTGASMTSRLRRFLARFAMSGWCTFLVFCGIAAAIRHASFSPADIRGRTDYRAFQIVAQGKADPGRLAFCRFEPGPPRQLRLDQLGASCFRDGVGAFELGSLRMSAAEARMPLLKEEPDYGWNRYAVLSDDADSQLIETETYYNSNGLITHYRVTGTLVEPVAQIDLTRGLIQLYVVFYLPLALVLAKLAMSLMRAVMRKQG